MMNELSDGAAVHVDGEVSHLRFACDLAKCQGACCTIPGGTGAPLLSDEPDEIARAMSVVGKYLPAEHQAVISREGLVVGTPEAPVTPCYEDRACVYVTYEGGIAKCAFEKAFLAGEIPWRKPLSCHLFPLRADGGYSRRLRYEFLSECQPAIRRGRSENIPLREFLKEPLIRAYGRDWYQKLVTLCERDHRTNGADLVV